MTATGHRPVSRPPRDPAAEPWSGPWRRFDIVKEFVIATVVVALLTVLLAAVFSSPDEKPITLQAWAKADSNDFVATAVSELNGQSGTASYGAPYNNAPMPGRNSARYRCSAGVACGCRSTPRTTSSSARCGRCPTTPPSPRR